MYCSYENLRRHAAFVLLLLFKSNLYQGKTGTITDPAELENAEQHLICLVQTKTFPPEKVFSSMPYHLAVSLKSPRYSPYFACLSCKSFWTYEIKMSTNNFLSHFVSSRPFSPSLKVKLSIL